MRSLRRATAEVGAISRMVGGSLRCVPRFLGTSRKCAMLRQHTVEQLVKVDPQATIDEMALKTMGVEIEVHGVLAQWQRLLDLLGLVLCKEQRLWDLVSSRVQKPSGQVLSKAPKR